ncbi:MAG TPA: hypothetical protein VM240_13425 [Verrucomicrobiae bacterium]|nr:hypothetical protein [Verrucomicrobiae bacterium]
MNRHAIPAVALLVLMAPAAGANIQQCAAVDDPTARLACYDALAGRPAAPAAALPAPAPSPNDFGKPVPRADEVASIESRIVGTLRQWQRGTRVKLDNGQVWKVTGDESGYYPSVPDNPEVVITKGFFGGYWLELKAVGRKIKVQRVS